MKAGILLLLFTGFAPAFLFARTDPTKWCGTRGPQMTEYLVKQHEFLREHGRIPQQVQTTATPIKQVGNIVVMKADRGNFITLNFFDLLNKKISFKRNPQGGFDTKVEPASLGADFGNQIQLGDDASVRINFTGGFSFPYFGTAYTSVFINSDGNLTFKESDSASVQRDVFRVLSGPPRICPFFQDLNPTAGGAIKVLQTTTKFTVTWDGVSEYLNSGINSNTFQVSLFKNGNIEFIFGSRMDTKGGIVGITTGGASVSNMKLVNYSSDPPASAVKNTTILERFATTQEIDWTGLVQEFQQVYPPDYDFVVVYSDFPQNLAPGAFAFFAPIQNNIKGIGLTTFNYSKFFNAPKMQGFLAMGWLGKFPDDPNVEFLFSNSTLEVMGQENGHRWLAYPQVMVNGVKTLDLLGRDDAHWNFYMDTDASVMEGNDIRDNGDGTFTTTQSNETYSQLDRYIMGLVPPATVPPLFFVSGNPDKERPPEPGVTFRGTRVDVNIQQIIQANGTRVPSTAQAQKKWKEAFILFTKSNTPAPKDLQKIERIRAAWTAFFHAQTGNRGTMDTTVQPPQ